MTCMGKKEMSLFMDRIGKDIRGAAYGLASRWTRSAFSLAPCSA